MARNFTDKELKSAEKQRDKALNELHSLGQENAIRNNLELNEKVEKATELIGEVGIILARIL